ncbi:hypothetical protein, partial [Streptomyces sp. CHB19.2]
MSTAWRRALTVLFVAAVAAGVYLALRGQDWSVLAGLFHRGSAAALLGAVVVSAAGLLCGARSWMLTLSVIAVP